MPLSTNSHFRRTSIGRSRAEDRTCISTVSEGASAFVGCAHGSSSSVWSCNFGCPFFCLRDFSRYPCRLLRKKNSTIPISLNWRAEKLEVEIAAPGAGDCFASSSCVHVPIVVRSRWTPDARREHSAPRAAPLTVTRPSATRGRVHYPVGVVAFNTAQGWFRNVTVEIADEVAGVSTNTMRGRTRSSSF